MQKLVQRNCIAAALLPIALALTSCFGGGGSNYSYQNVTVTLSPQITSLAVNASQTFTTTTTNAPNYPLFYTMASANILGVNNNALGTITSNTNGGSAVYTAPSTPPIYTAAQVANGAIQGQLGIIAFVPNSLTNVLSDASAYEYFTITAPSVTAGISPAAVSVPRGTTQQFTAYAVGNINGAITLQVNGVTGGSTSVGTITAAGLYTAPSSIPMSGATVTITVISVADPSKTATATVTVT